MGKRKCKYIEHADLLKFEEQYNKRINDFLGKNPETRVVFLNADFGWGKTTFIKNNLKVEDNCIYSPWLNKSSNYLEEIYYNVTKKDKGTISSVALFIAVVVTLLTIISGSIISILTEVFKDNFYTCTVQHFQLVCINNDNLPNLLKIILLISLAIILVIAFFIFIKPIPIISFFKKENGKYYEKRIIKNILKKVDKVLVIEDIDRADDIEEILIEVNKISEYIKEKNLNKYILVTGDYVRTIRRISEPTMFDNYNFDLATYRNKGTFLIEKIISLRIDFSSIKNRMDNIFEEYNLSPNLQKIEYDEIIEFIKNRFLSIRFFIRFMEKYKEKINEGYSLYHLLLKYYQEEKYFNIEEKAIENSLYNISKFPVCMNDIEMLLQCEKIKLPGKEYTKIEKKESIKGNYDIITNSFSKIMEQDKNSLSIFLKFFQSDKYPRLNTDRPNSNNTISIGSMLKPNNLKNDLDNYLIGYNNNEVGMMESILINKRCYFSAKNSSNNYEIYKINQVDNNLTEEVSQEDFVIAYISCFFRENLNEIENNYPKLYQFVQNIINNN